MGSRKWSIVTTSLKKGRMSSILIRGHSSRNDMASFRSWFFVMTCSAAKERRSAKEREVRARRGREADLY